MLCVRIYCQILGRNERQNKNYLRITIFYNPKTWPCTRQILTACELLQDASAPAQLEWGHSGDKGRGESTVLKCPKVEKISKKISEEMDQEKFFAIEERVWLFDRNGVI